jgi:hypothetical protein
VRTRGDEAAGREALCKYDPWKCLTGEILQTPVYDERMPPGTRNPVIVRRPNVAVTPVAAPGRASAVGGLLVPSQSTRGRMTAEQVIAQIERYEASSASNAYALGQCSSELSRPKRYRDELGFDTFEALLVGRSLPTRVTAFKLITVISTFSKPEVKQLGGTEKSYALIRYAKQEKPNGDPRRLLASGARVLGRAVGSVSARELNRALMGGKSPTPAQTAAAKKAASRLGSALRRAGVSHRMRVHTHGGRCVSAHFDPEMAVQLADMWRGCASSRSSSETHVEPRRTHVKAP